MVLSEKDVIIKTVFKAALLSVDPFNAAFYKVASELLGITPDQQFSTRLVHEFKIEPHHVPKLCGEYTYEFCYFVLYSAYKGIELRSEVPSFVETVEDNASGNPRYLNHDTDLIYNEYGAFLIPYGEDPENQDEDTPTHWLCTEGDCEYEEYLHKNDKWCACYPSSSKPITPKYEAEEHEITTNYVEYCRTFNIQTPFRLGVTFVNITTGKLEGTMTLVTYKARLQRYETKYFDEYLMTYSCKLLEREENGEKVHYLCVHNRDDDGKYSCYSKYLVFRITGLRDGPVNWRYRVFNQWRSSTVRVEEGRPNYESYEQYSSDEKVRDPSLAYYIFRGLIGYTYSCRVFSIDDLERNDTMLTAEYKNGLEYGYEHFDFEAIINDF